MADKRSKVITKPASKSKPSKTKTVLKSKGAAKLKASKVSSAKVKAPAKKAGGASTKQKLLAKTKDAAPKPKVERTFSKPVDVTRQVSMQQVIVKRTMSPSKRAGSDSASRASQFAFMKAPNPEHAFEVGDNVEVFCDHEKGRERVRGWIKGIVVQVDNKMVAVQFRSNVFLTDGWMVPDRILWYPLTSEHIRPVAGKKSTSKKDFIPDY